MKAFLSVYDKQGIDIFARGLMRAGIDVISTSGTHNYLADMGIETIKTSDITGFDDLLGGKIKTLHTELHRMIASGEVGIMAVNLMPLGAKGADDPLGSMDIGGVSLIRSGVKNWKACCVVTDPMRYHDVAAELASGGVTRETRLKCAIEAIKTVMTYDWAVLETLKLT